MSAFNMSQPTSLFCALLSNKQEPELIADTSRAVTCAAFLLGSGAEIDGQNRKGNTALHVAARFGRVEMVRWLVRMGADVAVESREAFEGQVVFGRVGEVVQGVRGMEDEVRGSVLEALGEVATDGS